MNRDNVYIFDKKDKNKILLGEIQNDFNMSFVNDGTKDSWSTIVWGYEESEIEPYTIVWHEKTNTWWVVSNDKVERVLNEDGGFIYIHNLDLLGAIELLNARDLTDCGFNQGRYTIQEFILRLFKLSTFEYNCPISNDYLDLNMKVNFVKTFENYTLLSALREFLDAYNCSAKLYFEFDSYYDDLLSNAVLRIVPKTGDHSLSQHNIDDFDDVREE